MHANEEAHADRVTAAVWHSGFLYTASADGCIKVRSERHNMNDLMMPLLLSTVLMLGW